MKPITQLLLLFCVSVAFISCTQESQTEEAVVEELPPQVKGEEISYSADDVNMNGYISYDVHKAEKRPGVLVVHEWWGHNEYARKRADMLAELGYVALAVDMYGDGKTADHPEDAGKFATAVFQNLEGGAARFQKAYEMLQAHPQVDGENIAAIGYCFGGTVVINMANMGMDLKGVAGFHAGLSLPIPPETDKVKAKILVCNGADDPMISTEQVEAFKTAMTDAGVDYTYISYPETVHSFTNPAATELGEKFEMPAAYNEEADKASWEELQKFFTKIFS
ncbi:MAG: dienelactone hydrolase family protein [Bacteroidota bacterium]